MAARDRIVPMVVACPLFLQNLDTSVMATALPSIARSLDVQVLHLNLAITSYLLSLAVFLPLSGWFAERFGARRVFCGAMMVPVGRLILLRSVPSARMVAAMVWFTVPPAIGRMAGPLFGGAIFTWTSWRWIFLINIPFGLLGIALALTFIDEHHEDAAPAPFDAVGVVPLASGMLTVATAIGSLATRTVMAQAIRRIGFRSLLIGATTLLVALQTLGFSEIPKPRMSHATTLSSMAQQVSVSIGVVFGASLVSAAAWWHGGSATHLMARDFSPAFVVVGKMTLLSLCFFVRLGRDEGAELR